MANKLTKKQKQIFLTRAGAALNVNVYAISLKGEKLIEYNMDDSKYPFIFEAPNGNIYKSTLEGARIKFGDATGLSKLA